MRFHCSGICRSAFISQLVWLIFSPTLDQSLTSTGEIKIDSRFDVLFLIITRAITI